MESKWVPDSAVVARFASLVRAGSSIRAVRLPSFSGHPIGTDLVSVGEDVHCEFVKEEVHPGVPA